MNEYMEHIMDHYKNPHNKGKLKKADIKNKEKNPACGDEIEISIKLKKELIEDIRFDGHGCAISQASASLITDFVKEKNIDDVLKLTKQDMLELLGVDVAPLRIKCVMLGLRVLQRGILQHKGMKKSGVLLSDIG
ncbi:MAG: SUF system NifU family Fe-S cluster assembly protein [Candidatus Woesearchaeota archaeon]|jgi:nitrogen fixation NifU-like protein